MFGLGSRKGVAYVGNRTDCRAGCGIPRGAAAVESQQTMGLLPDWRNRSGFAGGHRASGPRTHLNPVNRGWHRLFFRATAIILLVLMCADRSSAYSVLTHEEIVDLLWGDEIQPLLLKRYPDLTTDQIREAHAYAY